MNTVKLFLLAFLIAVGVSLLIRSCRNDPLAEAKNAEVSAVSDPAAEKLIAAALDAVSKKDMKKLFGMMLNGDSMYFDETYVKGVFAADDFTPASLRVIREVKRADKTFWQAEVFSAQRGKLYIFTLENDKKGILKISSVEEAPAGKK